MNRRHSRTPSAALLSLLALLALLVPAPRVGAANLQTQDVLYFSTHKAPGKVVGDDRSAFLLTEGGILVFDYRRKTWADNLYVPQKARDIRYSRSRLYVQTEAGRYLEYNEAFRRFTDASESAWSAAGADAQGAGGAPDLTGLMLEDGWYFLGDAVRDRDMRKAPVADARVFEYDNLWILSRGLGPFYGSSRRKRAASAWFGLDDPACFVVQPEGPDVWFGTCRPDGSLVRASADLGAWKVFPAQYDLGFGDGCIHDIRAWKGYVWLATEKGVVRHDPRRGGFKTFSHMQGTTYVPVHALHVHAGRLYAGSEEGAAWLAEPDGSFESLPKPGGVRVPVYELESKGKDLWAATQYGLYVYREDKGWQTLKEVAGKDVPESYGQLIPSLKHLDTTLYWLSGAKLMYKPRGQGAKVLLDRDRPFKLRLDGSILYVAFHDGVTAFDTGKNLWTDFRLSDGIPGTRVLSANVSGGWLWVGTDLGVTRIRVKPYLP
jgi:hypothetical protein